jgi:dTMP kinase
MQSGVRELFNTVFDLQQGTDVQTIDAGRSYDQVSTDISKVATECIARVGHAGPLGKLTALSIK